MEWHELSLEEQRYYITLASKLQDLKHYVEVDIEVLAQRIFESKKRSAEADL